MISVADGNQTQTQGSSPTRPQDQLAAPAAAQAQQAAAEAQGGRARHAPAVRLLRRPAQGDLADLLVAETSEEYLRMQASPSVDS